ncbi:MAG: tetratricopeptide repeat protein, partial [Acidobacteria bacterium]|nr:tetratricopeptide repeat protein [Acidobacteriota bacterium]
ASALARTGDLSAAANTFAEADPQALDPGALLEWGNVLAQLGRLPEAEDRFRRALERAPNLAPAHLGLGTALEAQGHPRDAIPHYRRAMELEPNPIAAQRLQALGVR